MTKYIIYVSLCLALFASCRSNKTVTNHPVVLQNTASDSIYRSVKYDNSLILRDTFIVVLNAEGDTVKNTEIHHRDSEVRITDTLYVNSVDTIRIPTYINITKEKAHVPSFIWYILCISLIINIGLIIIIWLVRKKAKQH